MLCAMVGDAPRQRRPLRWAHRAARGNGVGGGGGEPRRRKWSVGRVGRRPRGPWRVDRAAVWAGRGLAPTWGGHLNRRVPATGWEMPRRSPIPFVPSSRPGLVPRTPGRRVGRGASCFRAGPSGRSRDDPRGGSLLSQASDLSTPSPPVSDRPGCLLQRGLLVPRNPSRSPPLTARSGLASRLHRGDQVGQALEQVVLLLLPLGPVVHFEAHARADHNHLGP